MRNDIHKVANHETANMFAPAGCWHINVEPRACDYGNDRADIEVEASGGCGTPRINIRVVSAPRTSDGIRGGPRPRHRRGLRRARGAGSI